MMLMQRGENILEQTAMRMAAGAPAASPAAATTAGVTDALNWSVMPARLGGSDRDAQEDGQ